MQCVYLTIFGLSFSLYSQNPVCFLVQAAYAHHPWWWTEAKLAIVFTSFFSSFFFLCLLLSVFSYFHSYRSVTVAWASPSPWSIFSFFFFSFFYVFCFSPTSGKLPLVKFCFLPYFGIKIEGISKKKYLLGVIVIFSCKNADFCVFFPDFYGQLSVAEPGATPSPWTVQILNMILYENNYLIGPGTHILGRNTTGIQFQFHHLATHARKTALAAALIAIQLINSQENISS